MTSPWDGATRAPLRVVLAAVLACDVLWCARLVATLRPTELSHPLAPGWLLALGGNHLVLAALSLVGMVASVAFARRAGALMAGLVALGCCGVLVEAQAALLEGPMRFFFSSGACLLGWLFGLAVARWQGLDARGEPERVEALAETGAVAALASTYLAALAAKLGASGIAWSGGLRAVIASQHAWGHGRALDALTAFVLGHATAARWLAVFTLLAQASAIVMPWSRRGRVVAGALLLSFHAGVWLFTPILFPQAMLLLVAFCLPWPRWLRRLQLPSGGTASRASRPLPARATAAVALVVVVAWLPPVRAYTHAPRLHAAPPSDATRARFAAFADGADLGGARVLRMADAAPDVVRLWLTQKGRSIIVDIVPRGSRPLRAARTVGAFDLFYRHEDDVSDEDARAAVDAVARRLPR